MIEATNDDAANAKKSALIYCRVSTNRLAAGSSLSSQRAACVAHAVELGYTVARVTEEVLSGAELYGRPSLARDRADIRAGKFRAMIVYAVDRLTRNAAHLAILADECRRADCRLIFITGDCSSGEAYAAGVEREKILERNNRGHRTKLMEGRPVFNGWNLFGYRPNRAEGVYLVYEPEAAIVRRVFAMCAAGRGMHSIASTFNREGLPSPKSDKRPGARWTSGTICYILNDRSYMGEAIHWKTKRGPDGRDRPRPESERIRLPDGVRPPIVSRELWETCPQNIHARAARMTNNRVYLTLLRGHIFCAECGARMIRNYFKRGKYEYLKYRCGSRWRPFETSCRGGAINIAPLHEWAWDEVKSILKAPELIEQALKNIEQSSPAAHLTLDLNAARRELAHAAREEGALRSRFSVSEDNGDLWNYIAREAARASSGKRQLEKVIAELEARINEANQRAADLCRLRDCGTVARGNWDSLTFEDQRLALRVLGVRVHANGDDPTGWRFEVDALI